MKLQTFAAALLASTILAGSADAQQRRYDEWRDPNAPQQVYETPKHTEELVRELKELIRIGRRDRAAAPRFLDDVQAAIDRHEQGEQQARNAAPPVAQTPALQPSPQPVRAANIEDDFSDGDFTNGVTWEVIGGEYFITRRGRLASFVELPKQNNGATSQNEAVIQLFGTLLGGKKQNAPQQQSSEPVSTEAAVILLTREITNAFDLRTRLASDSRAGGTLEIGMFQGADARNGYRIQFTDEGRVRLIRVGRAVRVLQEEAFSFPPLTQDRRPGTYDVRWVRSRRGRMQVFINGVEAIDVADQGFRDDFDGFRMVNADGRHGMDAIRIKMLH